MTTVKNTDTIKTIAKNLTERLRSFIPDVQYAIIHEQLRQAVIDGTYHHTGKEVTDIDKTEIFPLVFSEATLNVFMEQQVKGLRYNLAFSEYVELVDYLPGKADKELVISLGRNDQNKVTFEFLGKTTLK